MHIIPMAFALAFAFDPQTQSAPPTTLPPVDVTAAVSVNPEDDRMVCRSESVVGSNRRQRVCKTVGQRRQLALESREFRERLDQQVNRSAGVAPGQGSSYESSMRGGGMVAGN